MPRKIVPRKLERSPLLENPGDTDARLDGLRATFLTWFQTVPGAEWLVYNRNVLHCWWYQNTDHVEWGKVFCAFRIDDLEAAKATVGKFDPTWMPIGAEWEVLGLEPKSATRESVIAAFYKAHAEATTDRQRNIATAAYGRALNNLYYQEQEQKR